METILECQERGDALRSQQLRRFGSELWDGCVERSRDYLDDVIECRTNRLKLQAWMLGASRNGSNLFLDFFDPRSVAKVDLSD